MMNSSKRTTRIAIQVVMIVRVPAEMDCCAAKNKELGGYPRLSERAVSTVSTNRIISLNTKSISRSSRTGNMFQVCGLESESNGCALPFDAGAEINQAACSAGCGFC